MINRRLHFQPRDTHLITFSNHSASIIGFRPSLPCGTTLEIAEEHWTMFKCDCEGNFYAEVCMSSFDVLRWLYSSAIAVVSTYIQFNPAIYFKDFI